MDFLEGQKPVLVSCSFCGEKIEMTQIVEHCKMCKKKYESTREGENNLGTPNTLTNSNIVPRKEVPTIRETELSSSVNQALERKYNVTGYGNQERRLDIRQEQYRGTADGREADRSSILVYVCPYCRVPQIPGATFCGACGARRDGYDERFLVDSTGVHAVM